MNPYEVLITKDVYNEDGDEKTPEILFGPKLVFAQDRDRATIKATIESGMSSDDVGGVQFYIKDFLKG